MIILVNEIEAIQRKFHDFYYSVLLVPEIEHITIITDHHWLYTIAYNIFYLSYCVLCVCILNEVSTIVFAASCGAEAQNVTAKLNGCGFDPHSRKLNVYLIKFYFHFLRSGVEAKRGVEFRHSTCNASRFWRKVGNGVS